MNVLETKRESVYAFNVDGTKEELKVLRDAGLKRIQSDEKALIEYAVRSILSDFLQDLPIKESDALNIVRQLINKENNNE